MNIRDILRVWLADIRFWIVVFFLIRLVNITLPPIEVNHNWRQTGTLMTVRLFHSEGVHLLYPQTEIAGADTDKVVASEFPVYNLLIYGMDLLFGQDHWYGRLISLVLSSLASWSFYRIIRRWQGHEMAFAATLILMCSVWFLFSRKIMPDVFALSLVMLAVHAAWLFAETPVTQLVRWWWFALFIALGSIGVLSKMPAAVLLCFLLPLIMNRQSRRADALALIAGGSIVALVMSLWYFGWVPWLIQNGAYQLYWPKSLSEGAKELTAHASELALRFYFTSFYSYVAFALFLCGIYLAIREKWSAWPVLVSTLVLLVFFMLKTGVAFPIQDYYMLPFIPAMALVAAYAWSRIHMRSLAWLLLVAVVCEGVANQQHDLRSYHELTYKLHMKESLDQLVPPGEPVAFLSDLNPSDMYFTGRTGWLISPEELLTSDWERRICENGGHYLYVNTARPANRDIAIPFNIVSAGKSYRLYRVCSE